VKEKLVFFGKKDSLKKSKIFWRPFEQSSNRELREEKLTVFSSKKKSLGKRKT